MRWVTSTLVGVSFSSITCLSIVMSCSSASDSDILWREWQTDRLTDTPTDDVVLTHFIVHFLKCCLSTFWTGTCYHGDSTISPSPSHPHSLTDSLGLVLCVGAWWIQVEPSNRDSALPVAIVTVMWLTAEVLFHLLHPVAVLYQMDGSERGTVGKGWLAMQWVRYHFSVLAPISKLQSNVTHCSCYALNSHWFIVCKPVILQLSIVNKPTGY